MIENEDYISIEVWNEQAGVWENVDEAGTMQAAREYVNEKVREEVAFFGGARNTFSIVQHKRTCFGKYAPKATS